MGLLPENTTSEREKPRNSVASLDDTNTQIYFFRKWKLRVAMVRYVTGVLCKILMFFRGCLNVMCGIS